MAGKYTPRNGEGYHRIKDDDPKAIALLKQEHQRFRELFDRAEELEGEALVPVAQEICMRLGVHTTIEEEIFYPALVPVIGADEVNEGLVEHAAGNDLVAEIEQLDGSEDLYKSKVHVLGEEILHHIDEEDEDMFEDARKAHAEGKLDLDAIGETLRARQAELYDQLGRDGEMGPTNEADTEEIESV